MSGRDRIAANDADGRVPAYLAPMTLVRDIVERQVHRLVGLRLW
jgi:hypothetical protein